jgi:SEC-C motif domain protein
VAKLKHKMMADTCCPCGAADCACSLYHQGAPAPDAGALMRSRYSAYVLGLYDYLFSTWHPDTCPEDLDLGAEDKRWLNLEIVRYIPEASDRATVEFVARYKINGRAHRLHEISRFVREDGRWFYLDGIFPELKAVLKL